jgi:hypothetical protein
VSRFFVTLLLLLVVATVSSLSAARVAGAASLKNVLSQAACSSGTPTSSWHGACDTFNGENTYYGIYGLGFPTPLGWMLCAEPAASGEDYPNPAYDYEPVTSPSFSVGQIKTLNNLGWAFSQAQVNGWWQNGDAPSFSSDDVAVAAKLLFDNAAYSTALPPSSNGIANALGALMTLEQQAAAMTAAPTLTASLIGGATSMATTASVAIEVTAPGLASPLANQLVNITLTNAVFSNSGLATFSTSTGSTGISTVVIDAATNADVTIDASASIGTSGLQYFAPTELDVSAQDGAAIYAPGPLSGTLVVPNTATPTPPPAHSTLLEGHKFNVASPSTAIPNATYDLYVEQPGPTNFSGTPPPSAPSYPGLTYVRRGETNSDGQLIFVVPVGYKWCLHEVATPIGYVLDPSLHCTGVLGVLPTLTIALPEISSTIDLAVHKFSANEPNVAVAHAYYELFVLNPFPLGYSPAPTPSNIAVPLGMTLWAINETNAQGALQFALPAGHAWCVREDGSPPGYESDASLHCTGVLSTSSPATKLKLAIPETLAFTGFDPWLPLSLASLLVLSGFVLLVARRRSTKHQLH